MAKKAGSIISRFSKKLFLYILPIVGVATFVATPANAYYRLTYEQASAIINTTNTNIRAETSVNYVKWTDGRTATNQTNKYLQGGTTNSALTLSTIDSDPVQFEGKEYYRKYKNYKKVTETTSLGISQPYVVATFVLTLENIAEDWHLYVLAPYNNTSGSLVKVGYTSWGPATNGNSSYADVTFYELSSADYSVTFNYQQYSAGNGQYGYQIGIFDIHLPAGNIGSVNLIYDSTKVNYNFTLAVNGIDGSNLVMTQIIEQLTQIQQNQQTIISYQQTIANHIAQITTMSDSDADFISDLHDRYQEIYDRISSFLDDEEGAWDDIYDVVPEPSSIDANDFSISNLNPNWGEPEFIANIGQLFNFGLINTMFTLSLVVAFLSYILFGKKA